MFRRTKEKYRISYERQRVQLLLKALGLKDHSTPVWLEHERLTGRKGLSFESFNNCFPTFPWTMAVTYVYSTWNDSTANLRYWTESFWNSSFWDSYISFRQAQNQREPDHLTRRPLAMVFPYQGIRGGLVLHNSDPQTKDWHFAFHEPDAYDDESVTRQFVVERYACWLAVVAKSGWSPESKTVCKPPLAVPTKPEQGGATIFPWIVKLLGIGPAALLFSWICRILIPDVATPYAQRFLSRYEGLRCIRATQEVVAGELGITPRQVRTALAALRNKGFIRCAQSRVVLDTATVQAAYEQVFERS